MVFDMMNINHTKRCMMKKVLLLIGTAICSFPVSAQWLTDQGHGITMWPADKTRYGAELWVRNDGLTYGFFQGVQSGNIDENEAGKYPMYFQILNRDGEKLLPNLGIVVSNYPNKNYRLYNRSIAVDNEGNAIICVSDSRLGEKTRVYSLYKYDEKGNKVYGDLVLETGVSVDKLPYGSQLASTSDGGVVVVYGVMSNEYADVVVNKVDKAGTLKWSFTLGKGQAHPDYSFPYVVDAGNNQTFLIYATENGSVLNARLIDFDGSSVWSKDLRFYTGGFGTTPTWTNLRVQQGPEYSALVSWRKPDDVSKTFENRICMIRTDGSIGLDGTLGGLVLSNDIDVSRSFSDTYCDAATGDVYAAFNCFVQQLQNQQALYVQKVSPKGELLWGANGIAVMPFPSVGPEVDPSTYQIYSVPSIRNAGNGKVAVLFLQATYSTLYIDNTFFKMVIYDSEGREVQRFEDLLPKDTLPKENLQVSSLIDNRYYLVSWSEGNNGVQIAKLALDGTTTKITTASNITDKRVVSQKMYNLQGLPVNDNTQGVVVEQTVYDDGSSYIRKLIK